MAISLLLLAKGRATQPNLSFAQSRYGYGTSGSQRAVSAGLAFGIAGSVGAALIAALAIPGIIEREPSVFTGTHIPMPTPAPIDQPPPIERTADPAPSVITIPQPRIDFPPLGNPPIGQVETPYIPPVGPEIGTGTGGGILVPAIVEIPTPVWRDARRDPRFARSFQPAYPPALEREGVIGTARVRVRIGADGRVISVENLGATHPDFFAATQRQALRQWRFVPATRDGENVESEQVLTVRFEVPPRN